MLVDVLCHMFELAVFLYDILMIFPVWLSVKMFSQRNPTSNTPRPRMVKESSEEICWRRDVSNHNPAYKEIILENKVDTITKAFDHAVAKYGNKNCLGTRRVIVEELEEQEGGKMYKKLVLGDYEWLSYERAHSISNMVGKGFRELGQEPGSMIAIYAETRAEWLLSALGAFSQSLVVTTLYTNLGEDAVVHGLNETEVRIYQLLMYHLFSVVLDPNIPG